MRFIGIDLHTNRFACCYLSDSNREKSMAAFELDNTGPPSFYATLTKDTVALIEATANTFAFASLFRPPVREIIIANTCQLKNINLQDDKTDKIDADKLARTLKLQFLGGERLVAPATVPPKEISGLRALFATCRIIRKQIAQTKNRIHSPLKENLSPYTKEYIFGKKSRTLIRSLSDDPALSLQINFLMDSLEQLEANFALLEDAIRAAGAPFIRQIDILASMSGISVITAVAIIADIIDVSRFANSKKFAACLRSAPKVESSNGKTINKSTDKAGRKLSITLLSQALNHFRDSNEKLGAWHGRLSVYKKKGIIRMALCRRVFAELYQMLKNENYHWHQNPRLHEKKMGEYWKFLEKQGKRTQEDLQLSA